ncbi:MAG: ADP-ribose diphosphatase [Oceanospirillaceae bacterium]|uniref:NUDIX domain-containing protein n=1 Tax=unclassified Thalassolituus TaxID=2624967 RepID=UPI000C5CB7AA|nr:MULTISPECIES: NUDIX domain-containing protein [unclassified Thalassolituus]MAS25660.1 ADP-ribose diphosphatase [Oceanospirillaceae bacterium]MAX98444.1 ADP-ribose diphosphatase [Oceanospirillaceae bacterium]MBL35569.1 ADP-ribose diphosphatase [Oceanospirillaceae bacterium]MBS51166.1 ADP-ribose diphosphatase [Oceanospirillaceae bacterium]|tara:strand:+ start:1490 stop:2110 length:621 start_codon:yes stop_codon:yes gene_type:complete
MKTPGFVTDDVDIVKTESVFKGFFRIDKVTLKYRLFRGGWTTEFTRELFERGEAVCVLLYDPVRDVVTLVEQFRIGALHDERSPWLLELVAGMVEEGEQYDEVARRETQEEAGCEFYKLLPICRYWVSPGGTSERVQLYCGLIDSDGVGGIHGLEEEHEDIRLVSLPFSQAWDLQEQGAINNAATIMALQWLKIHHAELADQYAER